MAVWSCIMLLCALQHCQLQQSSDDFLPASLDIIAAYDRICRLLSWQCWSE